MGRHRVGYQQFVEDEAGQGTVEYAVVTAALLCVCVALGALWRALSSGLFTVHALAAASHHVQGAVGWVADLFSC